MTHTFENSRDAHFQQAKSEDGKSRFLQIVAKPKSKAKPPPKLTRVAFRVSRLMEFCTRRELQNQTGHGVDDWPLVVLKELMDNALDACEEAEVAPVISITVKPGSITIRDNAGGIDTETIKSILDYSIRVSSREAYVSPTRGAQGNALKTILAMGYVLDREREDGTNAEAAGITIIETRGVEHRIEFRVDHVTNEPKITHTTKPSSINVGTKITIKWPAMWEWGRDEFARARGILRLVQSASEPCAGLGAAKILLMSQQPIQLGKNGDRAIRPARIGTTPRGCSAISLRMWPGIGSLGVIAQCGNSLPSFADFPELPSSAKCSKKSAARINR